MASADAAVIFDLQTLGRSPTLDACLARLLGGPGCGGGSGSASGAGGNSSGPSASNGSYQRHRSRSADSGAEPADTASAAQLRQACGVGAVASPAAASAAAPPQPGALVPGLTAEAPEPSLTAAPAAAASAAACQPPLKCGVGVAEDLRRLARTHPHMQAFRHIPRVLDLRHPWQALQAQKVHH